MKVGDRVRIISDSTFDNRFLGWEGVIYAKLKDTYDYLVQFKETGFFLHDGSGWLPSDIKPSDRHDCRCYHEKELELITDPLWIGTVRFDKPADGFTTRLLYADDIVCATTSYDLKDILSKKEENYMELLNIYENRKIKKFESDLESRRDKILADDTNHQLWKECFDKLEPLFDKRITRALHDCDIRHPDPTEDSKKKLDDNWNKYMKDKEDLSKLIGEVKSQLSLCETRDDKLEVLKLYKILKEDGKINA